MARSPAPLDPDKYDEDEDGLPRELVGAWASDKHERLARYVDISRGVRSRWIGKGRAGASFIDLFSGPARIRVKDTGAVMDGSPLIAWRESTRTNSGFTQIHIADADSRLVAAAEARLRWSSRRAVPGPAPAERRHWEAQGVARVAEPPGAP